MVNSTEMPDARLVDAHGGRRRLRTAACCWQAGAAAALLLAAGLAAALPAAAANFADYPPRRPGLWEMTIDSGRGQQQVVQYCVDAATDAALQKMGQASMGGMCSRVEMHRTGATLTADATCRMANSEVTTHSVTTFTGDTASHTVSTSHFNPPMAGGMADSKMTQDGRWLGACAADMRPGDMIINGNKMHMPMGAPGHAN